MEYALDREERIYLAGEFALGLLDGDEKQRFLRLMRTDPDLRAEVGFWQESMPRMIPDTDERPSPHVLRRLKTELFGEPERSLWQDLIAPENRGLLVGIVALKAAVIAAVLWLILGG
ncbi:hypothetical protein BOO69_16485 [Sulfitobacter alexandrii]|uniref:Anti-sigma factor n=1 Tax=Sulfitobacter alexandrii TaxID=1917485 RepID=A0A1J0WKF2_9RHOB|nr:hypothetical protein [Sulfitobacter alexandrii]APE44817.1 hypothetical protein BOO69_16485 [Sulfitobacter alexandrii]